MPEITVLDCRLVLCEPVFFASREIDRLYLTEALVGNYALTYALGLATTPYTISYRQPQYAAEMKRLVEQGVYVTPAYPTTSPRFKVERFNVQTETYWSTYTNGAILYDLAERGKPKPKPYPNNRPQQGMLKMMAQGMELRFFAFGLSKTDIPGYIRLGKFLSKSRLEVVEQRAILQPQEKYEVTGYFNPLDLPGETRIEVCNVLNIHPVPVLQNVICHGSVWKLEDQSLLPAGMRFQFEPN